MSTTRLWCCHSMYGTYLWSLSIDVFSVDGPRCTGPTFGRCPSMCFLLMSLNVRDLTLVVVHRCVLTNVESWGYFIQRIDNKISKLYTAWHFIYIYSYGLYKVIYFYIFIDSEAHLSTLKWKTVASKIKFYFTESFTFNASYSQGENVKNLL
jgi:hypothetical protein